MVALSTGTSSFRCEALKKAAAAGPAALDAAGLGLVNSARGGGWRQPAGSSGQAAMAAAGRRPHSRTASSSACAAVNDGQASEQAKRGAACT